MDAYRFLSIFADGPKTYSINHKKIESFIATSESYEFNLHCRVRRGVNINIRKRDSKNSHSAQFNVRGDAGYFTDALESIYQKMDSALLERSRHIDISDGLGLLEAYIAAVDGFEVQIFEFSQAQKDAFKYLQLASNHRGLWGINLSGPVAIWCFCQACNGAQIWEGWELPPPLHTIPTGLIFPTWKASRNVIWPTLNLRPVPIPHDDVMSAMKHLANFSVTHPGDVDRLESFALRLVSGGPD